MSESNQRDSDLETGRRGLTSAKTVISGTGLFAPKATIDNDELIAAFNSFVRRFNSDNHAAIGSGEIEALEESSVELVEKLSGIRSRHVVEKTGILDPEVLCPRLPERSNEEIGLQAEMGIAAARDAMEAAQKGSAEIDAVIVGCSNMQRPYPAVAIEIQQALGIDGFAFDLNVACSSATFALQSASNTVKTGCARAVLIVNPEICSGHLDFRDRASHFIFGDAATAFIVELEETAANPHRFEILGTRLTTVFSNNIRNNFGFLNRLDPSGVGTSDKLFRQKGRKVFKEVCPMVARQILSHLDDLGISSQEIRRLWLHQANLSMMQWVAKKVLGRPPTESELPVILDEYANTSSAGTIIAFHKYSHDLQPGDHGVICSFGAGYSVGSVVVRKC